MANQPSFVKRLQGMFGFVSKKTTAGEYEVAPADVGEDGLPQAIEFPSDIQRIWQYFIRETHDTAASFKNRFERYQDMDYCYYNDTIISGAVELYADETVQFDSQSQPITVNASDKKVVNYINDFFSKIGINQQTLKDIARNLVLYGDSFLVHSIKDKVGITESTPTDVIVIKDRIEFNAVEVKRQMSQYYGFANYVSRDSRLKQLADTLKDVKTNSSPAELFKSYLFGFQIEDDMYFPPWAVTHFRLMSSKTEFYPFGRPLLVNSISPFRQLKAAKNLMVMARSVKFPKERFQVKVDENMTAAEQWSVVNQAKDEYQNLSYAQGSREDFAVGGAIWLPEDLIKYDLLKNDINLDDIADIELLRDDIIMGTRIPKGYLIVDKGGWGASGQALLQQYKPFGRSVLQVQQAILRELIQLVKIQFIISGAYPEDTEFEILMNFPVIEDSSDRMTHKTSTIELAKSIISSLKDVLGINSKLPVNVIKDIFTRYSFLDGADIDSWVNTIEKENEKLSEEDSNKINKRLNEDIVRETYFSCKKKMALHEGIASGKHYMTSNYSDSVNNRVLETLKRPVEEENKKKRV